MRFGGLLLAVLYHPVLAVLYGDEGYAELDGKFYAFYSGGVAIVDPETCNINATLTQDNSGQPLPTGWSDGVYMQLYSDHSHTHRRLHSMEGYVLINSRDNRENSVGDPVSDVYIFDSQHRELVSIVEVGPQVVHSYGIHNRNEFWTHSDGDGHFYVIDLNDIDSVESKIKAHQVLPFHGKLLWDEDGTLGDRGFATSVGEQFLFELNIATAQQVRAFDFSSFVVSGTCFGLHAIAYSAVNQHVYAECSGGGGTLEFDVSDNDIAFVHQHLDQTGALYEVPDGSYVTASNKENDMLHVFKPNENGVKSSLAFDVSVPGKPSTPSFYPTDSIQGGADFIACMPLTNNPNKDQIDSSTGQVVCDYFTECTNPKSLSDIQHGVCLHNFTNDDIPAQLMRVTEVTDMELCSRCANEENFQDGTCICTPDCGSCDLEYETDLSRTGIACVDLGAVVDGTIINATLIANAGGVRQGVAYDDAPECSFGRTYRAHKRGQKYDASISNFPNNSIVIVDMSTQKVKCQVNLPGDPKQVVWVPNIAQEVEGIGPSSNEDEGSNDKSGGSVFSPLTTRGWILVAVLGLWITWN